MAAALGAQPLRATYGFGASNGVDADTIVVVSLRGGWDSLSIVAPTFEDRYYALRPSIAVPKSAALPLARGFGFHPALAGLHGLYSAGRLAVVHAVGTPDTTFSHVEAMERLERGTAAPGAGDGWLNRVLQVRGEEGVVGAVQMGSSLPVSLSGEAAALSMTSLQSFALVGFDDVEPGAASAFAALYRGVRHPLADEVRATVAALGAIGQLAPTPAANAEAYPRNSDVGAALRDVARLIKARLGLTIATLDVGGWDMHTNQGRVDAGDLFNRLTELDGALSAFVADLGAAIADVTVVLISEFGRTIRENGAGGTDHGHGQAMLVLGGGIKGGAVYGPWPGLADTQQFPNGSLAGRTDYRDVLGEVLAKRVGVRSLTKIFPDHTPRPLGLALARG